MDTRVKLLWVVSILFVFALSGCSSGGGGVLSASLGTKDDGLTAGTIYGKATDPSTGSGMGGIQIALVRSGDVSMATSAAKSAGKAEPSTSILIDNDGNYQSPAMLGGHYVLTASRPGFDSMTAQVDIPGGQNVRYDFSLSVSNGSTGIRGVLRDADGSVLSNATITLNGISTSTAHGKPDEKGTTTARPVLSTSTNANGFYILTNVTPGTYVVTVSHDNFTPQVFSMVFASGKMQEISLLMQPGDPRATGSLYGFVRDSRGKPIARANVSLDYTITRGKARSDRAAAKPGPTSSTTGFVRTDANGFYSFAGVLPDTYVVRAEHPQFLANSVTVTVPSNSSVSADIVLNYRLVWDGRANYYLGTWGSSVNDVYMVGALGAIKHFDGSVIPPPDPTQPATYVWKDQVSNTGENLFGVWGTADGSLVLAVGNSNLVLRTTDHGATWTPSGAGVGASCCAIWGTPDGKAIYVISPYGRVFKSTDLGLTWTAGQYTTDTLPAPRTSTALPQVGGLPDGSAVFVTGYNGTVYRSVDGGATWQTLQTGLSESFRHVFAWQDNRGRHVLLNGDQTTTVARSDDGGASWRAYALPDINEARAPYEQRSMWGLADGSAIYVLTDQYVCRSNNGGATWTKVADADVTDNCLWVGYDAVDGSGENVFQGATEGKIWQATDAGSLWFIVNQGDVWDLYTVAAFTSKQICAVGQSNPNSVLSGFYTAGLYGLTSEATYSRSKVNVFSLALRSIWGPTSDLIYAAAADKGICSSSDRGATWSQTLVADGDYITGIAGGASNAPMVAVGYELASDKGLILVQKQDQSVKTVLLTAGTHLRAVAKVPGQEAYVVVGDKGQILYSADTNFTTWTAASTGGLSDNLYAIWSPAGGTTMYACGDNGTLVVSTDSGRTWTKQTIGNGPFFGLWGTSNSDIFIVGLENYHFDGTSWTQMTTQNFGTVQTNKFYSAGVAGSADNTAVYAVGLGGRVYVYER